MKKTPASGTKKRTSKKRHALFAIEKTRKRVHRSRTSMNTKTTMEPRPRGRPKLENARHSSLLLKLNDSEVEAITRKAKRAGKVRADWIRQTLLAA